MQAVTIREAKPRLTDAQAERLWREIAAEREDGSAVLIETAEKAITLLGKPKARSRSRRRG